MPVQNESVIALYQDQNLTMQEIADRVGVSKARVHQILREAGVKTGYRYRPRAEKGKGGKAYRAYRMTPETRDLIDRLAETTGVSRTVVVTRAVEEMAARELKLKTRDHGDEGTAAGKKPARQGQRRGGG